MGRKVRPTGFRVGIIAQPDWHTCEPWKTFGRPRLFFAISAGNMDSMINRYTAVNCLGAGGAALLEALRAKRSGLAPCEFETAAVDTWVGEVPGLEEIGMHAGLEEYDCRLNRLAQLGLEQDGFAAAVAAARDRYGAGRIGVFIGTSTSGILEIGPAYRRRDPQTGALPASFRYHATLNTYSLGDFIGRYFGLSGPSFVVSSACSSRRRVLTVPTSGSSAGSTTSAPVPRSSGRSSTRTRATASS